MTSCVAGFSSSKTRPGGSLISTLGIISVRGSRTRGCYLGDYSDQFFDRREPNGEKVLSKIKPSLLDVPVEVNFKPRVYNGEQRRDQRGFGLIAVYNDEERRYHCDMTNLPVDQFSAESVTRVYALRWQVEILFQTMPGDHS